MHSSRAFELKIKQAEKHQRQNPNFDFEASLNDSFARIINVPRLLADEYFANFNPYYEKLYTLIDLYNNDLTKEDGIALSSDDWQLVIELNNRYASEIDLDVLQAVMQYLLDIKEL
ncbi:MAG: hypothetical protein FWE37_00595 [Spirochaetaceae bacterium]|nr:hypothetical protein [Spirochaetaceae bacterium]